MIRSRFALTVLCLVIALASARASAADYRSGFGFGISVPEVYLVLTREEVQENADLFLESEGDSRFERIPRAMRLAVFERVKNGQLEIFYRTEGVDVSFVDNVNIMSQRASLPRDEAQLAEICQVLPVEFSRMFGRPVGLDGCELRRVGRRRALYLAFDGAMPGTKTMQYQIERVPGEMIVITATAATANVSRMMGEFEGMIASIRIY